MEIEEQSIEFLNAHIESSFDELMGEYVIESVEWMEGADGAHRAYAPMMKSNIVILFPPFFPSGANNI